MDSQRVVAPDRCALHPDRGTVGACDSCGRGVCLDCAIPFRGSIRCERCAARDLGEPAPPAAARRPRLRAEHAAFVLSFAGLLATVPPWHRSGTLTSRLSAWRFGLDGWAAVACLALAAACAVTVLALVRPGAARSGLLLAASSSSIAGLAILVALGRAPGFFSTTLAPLLALGAAVGTVAIAAFVLVRRSRP